MPDSTGRRDEIAIIGMAGRFPGARNIEELWQNLAAGIESITVVSAADLAASGIDPAILEDPAYVKAASVMKDADAFDATFFGFHPREAELMDPQHRVLLECAWAALEHAGYDPETYEGSIGVYAGVARNTYFQNNLAARPDLTRLAGAYQTMIGNEKDFPATRVSYKLNLKGPSINVQTACSTSGVAIHLACQSLLSGECDLALAGGARIRVPLGAGYFYEEGGILSPDGHCRAFDARAAGTVVGSGAAVVVLKRLASAVRDGDWIHAVIRGTAINNDGSAKVGFTAPSVEGQARVIAEAHAIAEVTADTIGYVEAHGTGTRIGDPIEVAALTKAFRQSTDKKGYCAVGSVKTNIGHLDAGAGVTGLIKTVLALEHELIPPSLHYEKPNPEIDFANSPFYVNAVPTEWRAGAAPRRAGVSSFGLGGTNAHIVLEEAPPREASGTARPWTLLTLSAKTSTALETLTANLAAHLEANPELHLADVAYTLQVGRRPFPHRRVLVCRDRESAVRALEERSSKQVTTRINEQSNRGVAFLFPGGGAQYPNMGLELYRAEPVFREHIDACLGLLRSKHGLDLESALYPSEERVAEAAALMTKPTVGLPALFAAEYAQARLWMSWGILPAAMIGHSLGEYAAACLSGVLTLEDALSVVVLRARLFETLPEGGMLSVPLAEEQVVPLMGNRLSVAAVNGPALTVVSGPTEAIEEFDAALRARDVECVQLRISVAAHSDMVEPILAEFGSELRKLPLRPPQIPYVSNVTGRWIGAAEATDPAYWVRHLRQTVRFADGLATLAEESDRILLEVGPGRTLSTLAQQHRGAASSKAVFSSMRHPQDPQSDRAFLLSTLGGLWLAGAGVDWAAHYGAERRLRLPLPTYPFERKRHWVAAPGSVNAEVVKETASGAVEEPTPQRKQDQIQHSVESQKGEPTVETHRAEAAAPTRRARIVSELKSALHELSGVDFAEIDGSASFLEMGFDSLFLTQATQAFQNKFRVKITFRQLLEETSTLDALAAYLDDRLPAEAPPAVPAAVAPTPVSAEGAVGPHLRSAAAAVEEQTAVSAPTLLERVIEQQLKVMSQQLAALSGGGRGAESPSQSIAPEATPERLLAVAEGAAPLQADLQQVEPRALGPYKPLEKGARKGLSERQRKHLDALVARYNARTMGSKRLTEAQRPHLADPRAVSGFKGYSKEMVYQIAVSRSSGSRLWDVDGNEYIDFTMGFGVNFFGYSPHFVMAAIEEQARKGVELGVLSPLAREVADSICELTGMDRISFVNTGSEANMAALRAARTVTGRERIAVFSGSYHGIFDEVLVRGLTVNGVRRSVPTAPGIPGRMVEDVLVLDYGDPAAFDALRAHAAELAAVVVEPVQSRHPDLQPREFLHGLREVTSEIGAALIFDEVITGFRLHPRGAQGWYGVTADLASYGKLIGGGMPLAVVAGKSAYLDALDGGMWRYGDHSFPEVGVTFFGGTFVKHPLALAASRAVLGHLKKEGPELQENLNRRADWFVVALNDHFADGEIPIRIEHCGSMLFFTFPEENEFARLIFYYLRDRGVHIFDRPAFLSTAHSDADLDLVIRAVKESTAEMREADFLPEARAAAPIRREAAPGSSSSVDQPAEAMDRVEGGIREVPLTEAQREIWLATCLGSDASRAFNLSYTLRLTGPFDLQAFRSAMQQAVDRHEALRTTIPDGSTQRIAPSLAIDVPLVDLSGVPAEERKARVADVEAAEVGEPFDLVQGPLVRARVVRLDGDTHLGLVTAHHIVCDGWSFGVLMRDLSLLYSSAHQGGESSLPPPIQLREYVLWQEGQRASGAIAEAEAYWLKQFEAPVPNLELPVDARPPFRTYNGARQGITLAKSLSADLKRIGARNGCTLFSTLLAGFQAFLHRMTGQDDFVVGVGAAGQALVGHDLVGHCVNLLPLRTRIDKRLKFSEYLRAAGKSVLDAHEHQNYTYGSLIRKVKLERDPSRLPLVSVTFNMDPAFRGLKYDGLAVDVTSNARHFENFELFLNVAESEAGLQLALSYNTDLFRHETIERWLGHIRTFWESVVADPDRRITDLPILDERELGTLLVDWNATVCEYAVDETVLGLFEAQVERTPDAAAVASEGAQLTYRELNRRANQVARHLRKQGVGPEVLVGVCMERSLEMVVGILGVIKAGGAYVPLDPKYPADRLAFMLEDARAPVLLTQQRLLEGLPNHGAHTLCLDSGWQEVAQESEENPVSGVTPESLAYVIYTSGSTGRPKGVMIEHRSLVNLVTWHQRCYGVTPADRATQLAGPAFDASVWELWPYLTAGASLYIPSDTILLSPPELLEWLAVTGITLCFLPTPLAEAVLEEPLAKGLALRALLTGGDKLHAGPRQELPYCLINHYGPTENTVVTTSALVAASRDTPPPIGRPIANTQVYILDWRMEPVPVGVPGELCIGGAGLARGYLNRPELTAERFVPDPFSGKSGDRLYKTGDLARYLPDGNIEFLGRLDHQVKVRGFRIELGEVEVTLARHGGVKECVVIVREDQPGERRLVAYWVARDGSRPSVGELRTFLGSRLPEHMVPSAFLRLEALPLTPNGKVDRRALPAPGPGRPVLEEEFVLPRSSEEEVLARIWAEVLRLERVGVHDNFFELGGDSILSIQIIAKANQAGLRLTPRQMFQHQTIAELAAVAGAASTIGAEQGAATGQAPLTPIQRWFFEQELAEPHHFNQALLLELRRPLKPAVLEEALRQLVTHHDALRLRFEQRGSDWQQAHGDASGSLAFSLVNLSTLSGEAQASALEARVAELQAGLDHRRGPLFRGALIDLGATGSRLLLVIHHLVVDGVSWRILLGDLETAYRQLDSNQPVAFPYKTTSFQQWAQKLTECANSDALDSEDAYWSSEARRNAPALPLDHRSGSVTVGSEQTVVVSLTKEDTESLLQAVPAAYHTQINDVLLAALLRAFGERYGTRSLWIDLEGHGREAGLIDGVDLSRTVGWFTSIFPVLLRRGAEDLTPEAELLAVQQQLREIPNRGIGYGVLRYLKENGHLSQRLRGLPPAKLSFNYLGQFDQTTSEGSLFGGLTWAGSSRSPDQRRSHLLEIGGLILNGRLEVAWSYAPAIHDRATIDGLAHAFMDALTTIIARARSLEPTVSRPSKMPELNLSQDQLSRVLSEIRVAQDEVKYDG